MTNHPNRTLAARNRRITSAYARLWPTLDALFDYLTSDDNDGDLEMQLLPTYGGVAPTETAGVWSWDDGRLLIETDAGYEITNR